MIDGTRDGVWRECRSERSHCWLLVIFSLSDGGPVHLLSHPVCHHSPAGVAPPLGLSPSGSQRSGCPETGGSTLRLRSAQLPLLGRTPAFLTSVASGEGVGSDVSMGRWEGREGRAAGEEVAPGSPALRHTYLVRLAPAEAQEQGSTLLSHRGRSLCARGATCGFPAPPGFPAASCCCLSPCEMGSVLLSLPSVRRVLTGTP